jgi:hypothetical protein
MPAQPRALREAAAGAARTSGLPDRPADLPHWAKNRAQRVHGRKCAACGGVVLRAPRGPAPRHCVSCAVDLRRRGQLRAYLRSAERLARAIGLPDVADAAGSAIVALDAARHD